MTEGQFLACTDPRELLAFLQGKASRRKFRLFACACCRAIWPFLEEEASQKAVGVAEAYADGQVGRKALLAARKSAGQFSHYQAGWVAAYIAVGSDDWYAARDVIEPASRAAAPPGEQDSQTEAIAAQRRFAHLLRDLTGNPFRPVSVDPFWLTPTVVAFAQTIYEDQGFEQLPILGDALEEAGCTNPAILNHCRLPAEHARGCWVIDLLLGRE